MHFLHKQQIIYIIIQKFLEFQSTYKKYFSHWNRWIFIIFKKKIKLDLSYLITYYYFFLKLDLSYLKKINSIYHI
jgi:hypothetical protein